MKKFPIIIVISLGLFLMGCQSIQNTPNTDKTTTGEVATGTQEVTGIAIQSFEDCLNAGFPIMESYPRQCNDGTTTYTEEISQDLSGQQLSGETAEQTNEAAQESSTSNEQTQSAATGTDLTILQQKLKAMMERRNQQQNTTTTTTETNSNTASSTNTPTNTPATASSNNDQITEKDIENLEKLIDNIVQKK